MPQDYPQTAVLHPAYRAAAESGGQELDRRNLGMSDFWHKMGCCVVAKPPPKKKRRKIDRSMIGEPTNFIHLTHIGSGEMAEGLQPLLISSASTELNKTLVTEDSGSVQEQMRSKGPNMAARNSLL